MNCKNCGSFNPSGKYCTHCGQKLLINLTPHLKDAIHDGIHEFFHLDGKIFKTLRHLFFSPGFLTVEFLSGRRASYINPLRVYLTMSVLYLLVVTVPFLSQKSSFFNFNSNAESTKLEPSSSESKDQVEPSLYILGYNVDEPLKSIKPYIHKGIDRAEKDNGKEFKKIFYSTIGKALFILLPVFAFFLYLSYWRKRNRSYLPYFYFSVHIHSALFGGLLIANLLETVFSSYVLLLWLLWILIYLFLAMKRVWPDTKVVIFIRTFSVLFSYTIVFFITLAIIVIYSAYKLGSNVF